MIDSFNFLIFLNKSAITKLAITAIYNLQLFLAEANEISSKDKSSKNEFC